MKTYNVLILGASYGSLLATKLAMAGHDTSLVCLPAEAEAINRDGAVVRLPGHCHINEIYYCLPEVRSGPAAAISTT